MRQAAGPINSIEGLINHWLNDLKKPKELDKEIDALTVKEAHFGTFIVEDPWDKHDPSGKPL